MFRRSSAVEQLTVNQLVVGSIPTVGAKNFKDLVSNHQVLFLLWNLCANRFSEVYETRAIGTYWGASVIKLKNGPRFSIIGCRQNIACKWPQVMSMHGSS